MSTDKRYINPKKERDTEVREWLNKHFFTSLCVQIE